VLVRCNSICCCTCCARSCAVFRALTKFGIAIAASKPITEMAIGIAIKASSTTANHLQKRSGFGWAGEAPTAPSLVAPGGTLGASRDGLHLRLHFPSGLGAALPFLLSSVRSTTSSTRGSTVDFSEGGAKRPRGSSPREHFVEDDAERIDVGALVHVLRMFDLFRRHVLWRAESFACFSEIDLGSVVSPGAGAPPSPVGWERDGVRACLSAPTSLAMPKSAIFTRPFRVEQDVLAA